MRSEMDLWLARWLALLQSAVRRGPVLELGCDSGRDTQWLLSHGLAVVATDLSFEALRARYAEYKRFFSVDDLKRFFPSSDWRTLSREERSVFRYDVSKIAWELVLQSPR